jgi:hypothetical protein
MMALRASSIKKPSHMVNRVRCERRQVRENMQCAGTKMKEGCKTSAYAIHASLPESRGAVGVGGGGGESMGLLSRGRCCCPPSAPQILQGS